MIKILKPGLQTLIQDAGRIGHYEIGMPPSGALDQYSYRIGNLLVGNEKGAAAIEATYMGPEIEFQENSIIALTGAEIPPKINGIPVPMWQTIEVNKGDKLTFDFLKKGARVYISVAGGIDVPKVMGARATYMTCKIGGYEGRPLKEGDLLKIGSEQVYSVKPGTTIPKELIPQYSNFYELRIIDGLCSYRLMEESKQRLTSIEWTITPEANRVGYRLKGERLHFVSRKQPFGAGDNPSNVVDVGYPIGSIQIPDGVEPIILLNDAVTSGGYATIGTIISADLNTIAQAKTHDKIKFVHVTMEEALQARREVNEALKKIEYFINSSLSIGSTHN